MSKDNRCGSKGSCKNCANRNELRCDETRHKCIGGCKKQLPHPSTAASTVPVPPVGRHGLNDLM